MVDVISSLVILLVLLAFSAFFSASEIAIFSLNPARVKRLIKEKKSNAKTLEHIKKEPQKLLVAILIGNNIMNILATSYSTIVAYNIFGDFAIAIVTGLLTVLLLIFGEITPKNIGIRHNVGIALFAAPFFDFVINVFWPLIFVFEKTTGAIAGLFSSSQKQPSITEEEVNAFISMGVEEGTIQKREKEFIHRVFEFNDIVVGEIMQPRTEIKALPAESGLNEIRDFFNSHPLSRIPVYNKSLDNIEGILYVKDIISFPQNEEFSIRKILRPAMFVPETKKIDKLFQEFKTKKIHMAVVADEYGGTVGLVTLEDVLEELVGEIEDEKDKSVRIEKLSDNQWQAFGETSIEIINANFSTSFSSDNVNTLAGFLTEKMDKIPSVGEIYETSGLHFTVRKVKGRKIQLVEIRKTA